MLYRKDGIVMVEGAILTRAEDVASLAHWWLPPHRRGRFAHETERLRTWIQSVPWTPWARTPMLESGNLGPTEVFSTGAEAVAGLDGLLVVWDHRAATEVLPYLAPCTVEVLHTRLDRIAQGIPGSHVPVLLGAGGAEGPSRLGGETIRSHAEPGHAAAAAWMAGIREFCAAVEAIRGPTDGARIVVG